MSLAGSLEIEIVAEMSKLASDLKRAEQVTGQSMAAISAQMKQVNDTIAAMAEAEKARAGVFANTWSETKRLLGIVKVAAEDTSKALAGMKIPAESIAHINTWSEQAAYAIGSGAAVGWDKAKKAWEGFKDWLGKQLVIWGVALALGVTAAVITAVYAAFKAVDFAIGLLTGKSYKSANIDAAIALNKEVMTLQENLSLTAVGASAFNEALKAQGLTAAKYVETIGAVSKAVRSNREELDRLGVVYKDANGVLLSNEKILGSAAAVLATYTEGWDRQQAAIAIGMGSEKQIQAALAMTAEKIEIAKERLIEYGLIIGPGTQEAVVQYEEAMRAFNREADLTSLGFKKAISDNVMPALTELAVYFTDGFPKAVQAFRFIMAQVVSLFYGLATVAEVATASIITFSRVAAESGLTITNTFSKLFSFDFSGARDSLVIGLGNIALELDRWKIYIFDQARHNKDAMVLAFGGDTFAAMGGGLFDRKKVGKAWKDAPKKEEEKPVVDMEMKLFENAVMALENELGKLNAQTQLEKTTLALYGTEIMDADGKIVHITGSLEKLTQAHADQLQMRAEDVDVMLREQERSRNAFKLIEAEAKDKPLLLLDDVMSELDEARRRDLMEMVKDGTQVLITSTTEDIFEAGDQTERKVIRIRNGSLADER